MYPVSLRLAPKGETDQELFDRIDALDDAMFDWFAGQALAMSIPAYVNLPESADILAKRSYGVAKAMMAERERLTAIAMDKGVEKWQA